MYVLTESQMTFTRSERDFAGFEAAHFRKLAAAADYAEAPKRHEYRYEDEGRRRRPFTVVLHAVTGLQIGVLDGHR